MTVIPTPLAANDAKSKAKRVRSRASSFDPLPVLGNARGRKPDEGVTTTDSTTPEGEGTAMIATGAPVGEGVAEIGVDPPLLVLPPVVVTVVLVGCGVLVRCAVAVGCAVLVATGVAVRVAVAVAVGVEHRAKGAECCPVAPSTMRTRSAPAR